MTAAEIIDAALLELGEASDGSGYYTRAEVLAAVNQGQRMLAFFTLGIERTVTLSVGASVNSVQMTGSYADWIAPLRLECGGVRVERLDLQQFTALSPVWRTETGARIKRYACVGCDLVYLHPAPADTVSLRITYAAMPVRIASEASTPEVPTRFHDALKDYAVWRCRMKEGSAEMSKPTGNFQKFIAAMNEFGKQSRDRAVLGRYDTIPPMLMQQVMEEKRRGN